MVERARVTPSVLAWARTSMNLDLETAARRADVKAEQLEEWERGNSRPSVPQARRLAHIYRRPLAALYLPEPPRDFTVPHDYRRLPEGADRPSPQLIEAIRSAEFRRSTALDLGAAEAGVSGLVGVASLADDPEQLAARVREQLAVSHAQQRGWRTKYDALNGWKSAIEAHNVLVFHFSGIPVDEARAFSVSYPQFPVIAVNGGDSVRARIFSLLHEVAHLVIDRGGISDNHETSPGSPNTRVEVFCNRFAGAVLVPADQLLEEPIVRRVAGTTDWADEELRVLADTYMVSREVVLRRLLILGRTTEDDYRSRRERFAAETRDDGEEGSGFLTVPRRAVRAVGQPFARMVLTAYYDHAITLGDVSEFLGVRVKHVPAIESLLAGRNTLTGSDR
jgi:Zn-dependent peptidase ImmA (M78 family)